MKECYIVYFCTGEYSDYMREPMAIFTSKQGAEDYAEQKRAILNNLHVHAEGDNSQSKNYSWRSELEGLPELEGFCVDYTGAWIKTSLQPLPLFDA